MRNQNLTIRYKVLQLLLCTKYCCDVIEAVENLIGDTAINKNSDTNSKTVCVAVKIDFWV